MANVLDFMFYDWSRLLDVFKETAESHKLREYVKECQQNGCTLAPVNRSEWEGIQPIELDEHGDIISIDLSGQQLTDLSIGESDFDG